MQEKYLQEVIDITVENIEKGGRPFGAILVKDGKIIARAVNTMLADCDPTAHAEMSVIRKAGKALETIDLQNCTVYASGEPCPMCQAAMYMAGIREVYYVFSNADGEIYGLSTQNIAKEMMKLPNDRTGSIFRQVDASVKNQFPNLYRDWANKGESLS